MKRILAVAAVVALLAGCDSKPDAPFGLKWGQSMDSVSFIKDGDCEKKRDETVCTFDNTPPFNEWTYENRLKFKSEKLVEVSSFFNAVDDKEYFCVLLGEESKYLAGVIKDGEKLFDAAKSCLDIKVKPDITRDAFYEKFTSTYGVVKIYLTLDPYVGIITYSPPEK
nr:hypothetical protein [Providencia sp. R33]